MRTEGEPWVERRRPCGCPSCGWWGDRAHAYWERACPRCSEAFTEPLRLVLSDGRELPVPS